MTANRMLAAVLFPLAVAAEEKLSVATTPQPPPIIVTATAISRYRAETTDSGTLTAMPPQELPLTVEALTRDFIRDRNPTDLDNLLAQQPGIYTGGKTVMSRTAGQYTIRGYSGSEVFLGGVPLTGGVGTFLDPVLLERVDVVKGPVGSISGGETSSLGTYGAGGSVVLIPRRPDPFSRFTDLELRASTGSGQRLRASIDINQPLDAQAGLYARLPVAYEWRDPAWAPSGARSGQTFTIAPSLLWEAADRLNIGLDMFVQYSDQPAYQGIPTIHGTPWPGYDWDSTTTRPDDHMTFLTDSFTLYAEGRINEIWRTRTTLSFAQTENRYDYRGPSSTAAWTNPKTFYEYSAGDTLTRRWYASQHFAATFDTGPIGHELLLGADYLYRWKSGKSYFGTTETPLDRVESDTETLRKTGLILQDTLSYRRFRLLLGTRFDSHTSPAHTHAWSTSPRAGLTYLITDSLIAFGNISLSEAPNFAYNGLDGKPLDSSWRALQYEGGLRYQLMDDCWLNAALFQIDQDNTPVAIAGSGDSTLYALEGSTRSRGIELSATGNLTENWSLFAAYTFIDYSSEQESKKFDRYPPHALSIWTTYKADWLYGTVFGAGYRWRDEWVMTLRGVPQGDQYCAKALQMIDLSAEVPLTSPDARYPASLTFGIKNLFDRRGIESARNCQAFANDGRTFEITLRFRF